MRCSTMKAVAWQQSTRTFSSAAAAEKTVLVLGAGLVARPCVEYLSRTHKIHLVSAVDGEANKLAASLDGGRKIETSTIDVAANWDTISKMVQDSDLAISLLPAPMHPEIAKLCLEHGKDMVTASYVSPEMKELDAAFKESGLVCLNEVGVDPGMDHMSAQKVIDEVEAKGGKVRTFSSVCGGLPAPEAATNQLRYKFSWSPRGVVTAAKNNAQYKQDNEIVKVASVDLLASSRPVENAPWPQLDLEHLPNRDSVAYEDIYRLKDAHSVYRGTLRYTGWCGIMNGLAKLGLLDDTSRPELQGKLTWNEFMGKALGVASPAEAVSALEKTGIEKSEAERAIKCAEWLGCYSDDLVDNSQVDNVMDIFCNLLQANGDLWFKDDEKDMLAMHHEFGVEWPEGVEGPQTITSSLLCFGEEVDSAMARTVGITTGIAADIVLDGSVKERGVLTPVTSDIYLPGLDRLAKEGLAFEENEL